MVYALDPVFLAFRSEKRGDIEMNGLENAICL